MYANMNSQNETPLGEESLRENPLLVNSKIFSKSQQFKKQPKKRDSLAQNHQENDEFI